MSDSLQAIQSVIADAIVDGIGNDLLSRIDAAAAIILRLEKNGYKIVPAEMAVD